MPTISANYGFTVDNQNGKNVFNYTQEKYKARHLLPAMFLFPLWAFVFLLFTQPSSFGAGLFEWLLFTFGGFFLVKYLMNRNRKPRQFTIDSSTIEVEGKRYERQHITSLYVQEGKEPASTIQMNHGTVVSFHPSGLLAASVINATHGATALVGDAGRKLHRNLARINGKIFIRYGNKNEVLAKGITIDTAELMLEKIKDIIS